MTLRAESQAVVAKEKSQQSPNADNRDRQSGADLEHVIASADKRISRFESGGQSTIMMSPELQNTQ